MELSEFLLEPALIEELESEEKEPAIRELTLSLEASGAIHSDDLEKVIEALMKREELGSTGIGKGVAVPHARHSSIKKLIGVFGHSSKGVEFASLDGEPVHAIFLLLSPVNSSSQHLAALSIISQMLRNDTFCHLLKTTQGRDKLVTLIKDARDFIK